MGDSDSDNMQEDIGSDEVSWGLSLSLSLLKMLQSSSVHYLFHHFPQELSEPDGGDEVDDDDQEFGDMFGDDDADLQPG